MVQCPMPACKLIDHNVGLLPGRKDQPDQAGYDTGLLLQTSQACQLQREVAGAGWHMVKNWLYECCLFNAVSIVGEYHLHELQVVGVQGKKGHLPYDHESRHSAAAGHERGANKMLSLTGIGVAHVCKRAAMQARH